MNKDKKEEVVLTKERLQKRNATIADFITYLVKKHDYEEKEINFKIENKTIIFKDLHSALKNGLEFCKQFKKKGDRKITFCDMVIVAFIGIFGKSNEKTKFSITNSVRLDSKMKKYFNKLLPYSFAVEKIEDIVKMITIDYKESLIYSIQMCGEVTEEDLRTITHIFNEGIDYEYETNEFLKEDKNKINKDSATNSMLLMMAGFDPIEAGIMGQKMDPKDALFISLLKSTSDTKPKLFKADIEQAPNLKDKIDSISNTSFDSWFEEPFKKIERSNDEINDWITRGLTLKNEFEKKFGKTVQSEIQKLR